MANPQKENGYTAIANDIMDALISSNLSGQDLRISLLVMRKTYGFNKTEDSIALSQMMAATSMGKIRCSQVVNRLQLMKILTVTENINGICKKYKFNKDFESWDTVNVKCNRYEKTKSTVKKKRNQPLRKTVTTKDNITKDNITKDNITKEKECAFHLPDFIRREVWDGFEEMRKKIKKPMTDRARNGIIKEAVKIRGETNADINDIIDQSTRNSWQDVYEIKNKGGNSVRSNPYQSDKRGKLPTQQGYDDADEITRRRAARQQAGNDTGRIPNSDDVPDFPLLG